MSRDDLRMLWCHESRGVHVVEYREWQRFLQPGRPGERTRRLLASSKAAAFHNLTWANSGWRASLARLWNHRERAWWRRVHASQWMTSRRGSGRVVRAASSRLISGMVSGIMPGSAGGGWPGQAGGGAWVPVRSLRWAAVMAQMARAAITSTACRAIAV